VCAARSIVRLQKQPGELALVSQDCLNDLAPAENHFHPRDSTSHTPRATACRRVAQGKIQFPMLNQQRQQRSTELQIRQDYLKQAMESAIREAQSTQMKLAKVAAGDETYRVARDSPKRKYATCKSAIKQTN